MKRNVKVSTAVIRRLPRYYRHLSELQRKGIVRISSSALGKSIGLTASQIRQDLFCFGGFGQQGYGYKVDVLKEQIGEILGISRGHTIVVLGAGNLGRALIENFKFSNNGFQLLAAFDVQERTVGTQIAGVPVYHADTLESFLAEHPASVGLLTVPKSAAQEMGRAAGGRRRSGDLELYQLRGLLPRGGCGGGERPLLRQSAGPQLYDLPAGGRRGRGRKGADMRRKTARLLLSGGVLAAVLSGGAAGPQRRGRSGLPA